MVVVADVVIFRVVGVHDVVGGGDVDVVVLLLAVDVTVDVFVDVVVDGAVVDDCDVVVVGVGDLDVKFDLANYVDVDVVAVNDDVDAIDDHVAVDVGVGVDGVDDDDANAVAVADDVGVDVGSADVDIDVGVVDVCPDDVDSGC